MGCEFAQEAGIHPRSEQLVCRWLMVYKEALRAPCACQEFLRGERGMSSSEEHAVRACDIRGSR